MLHKIREGKIKGLLLSPGDQMGPRWGATIEKARFRKEVGLFYGALLKHGWFV